MANIKSRKSVNSGDKEPEVKNEEVVDQSGQDETEQEQQAGAAPESEEIKEAPTQEEVKEEAVSKTPHEDVLRNAMEVTEDDLEMFYVNVPRDFNIRINQDVVIKIRAGAQRLEKILAEHWYAINHGVTKIV